MRQRVPVPVMRGHHAAHYSPLLLLMETAAGNLPGRDRLELLVVNDPPMVRCSSGLPRRGDWHLIDDIRAEQHC